MRLLTARVYNFRCIEDSNIVNIEPKVTVLVGQNESGKTAFLKSLDKTMSFVGDKFNVIEDYPRRYLTKYEIEHKTNPAIVVSLTFQLIDQEIQAINKLVGVDIVKELEFSLNYTYDNKRSISIKVPQEKLIKDIIKKEKISGNLKDCKTIDELVTELEKTDKNQEQLDLLERLKKEYHYTDCKWENHLEYKIWKEIIVDKIPQFLYFDDYYLLPGKVNIQTLSTKIKSNAVLDGSDKTTLGLLKMADVSIDDLASSAGYEESKSKLEAISNTITDQVFEYWTQNKELDVEIDIRNDPNDSAPYNNGNNLYIRIKNRRHRVTVPFSQRSKGFIWFFSFMVWFDSVQNQLKTNKDIILLLDEPGLSLHALAQEDLLKYIEHLAQDNQIIFTTHSPFMVRSERLFEVRVVEDVDKVGTKVSSNISKSDPKTIFPLQAALGYDLAQNLFISKNNLLVEGPSDLVYLTVISSILEQNSRPGIKGEYSIVPVGGADKVATFISLLAGNKLNTVCLLDDFADEASKQRLQDLINEKIVKDKNVRFIGEFTGIKDKKADLEDLFEKSEYLSFYNTAFGSNYNESELDSSKERIIEQINLKTGKTFNHFRPANALIQNEALQKGISKATLDRFEKMFEEINKLFK